MDRVWQWVWGRYGRRYSWAVAAVTFATLLPTFVTLALVVAAWEGAARSDFVATVAIAIVGTFVAACGLVLPGTERWRAMERWAAGDQTDRFKILESTYSFARTAVVRAVVGTAFAGGATAVAVGAITGAVASRVIQFGINGVVLGGAALLVAMHTYIEGFMRPPRIELAGGSAIGDALPRPRPTYAMWSNVAIVSSSAVFALGGAEIGTVIDRTSRDPAVGALIAICLALFFAVPLTVTAASSPALEPIRDLARGTERVVLGDYSQRLPVVQDDDLGVLVASFNRMQAGLAERERLQAAFGSYVDPLLALRLIESGSSVFEGEHVVLTVLFADVRDFTSFSEGVEPADAVDLLNRLFDVIVPVLHEHGGHANHYLGDGLLAIFGAPNPLDRHADAAVAASIEVQKRVRAKFGSTLRLGIGVNTGAVIAGTVGGGGRLEFTVIGDTVNTAARVEQLTKDTGDAILITEATREALSTPRPRSIKRGAFDLKGKASKVTVHAVNPFPRSTR